MPKKMGITDPHISPAVVRMYQQELLLYYFHSSPLE